MIAPSRLGNKKNGFTLHRPNREKPSSGVNTPLLTLDTEKCPVDSINFCRAHMCPGTKKKPVPLSYLGKPDGLVSIIALIVGLYVSLAGRSIILQTVGSSSRYNNCGDGACLCGACGMVRDSFHPYAPDRSLIIIANVEDT